MKRARKDSGGAKAAKKPPAKRGARKMPPPMPKGEVVTDFTKKTDWVLGSSVGKGGFGEIYTAAKSSSRQNEDYVVKIEPHENGPLFTELSFYRRIAKPAIISSWSETHRLSYHPVPEFIAAGEHTFRGLKYRFMVMHRYGEDIEKKFTAAGRQFGMKTVCYLALRLLEALEFLHESEYVHADVKGSNLLTGLAHPHQVYLVDYGLAYRYRPEGVNKEYSEDPRRKHDGTIEFTSIDAHNGANPSRRADLEILGYCLLQWASGRLPWEGNLEDKEYVAREKKKYKRDVGQLMSDCFHGSAVPLCLRDYMKYVYRLEYTQQPDYRTLKGLFQKGLKDIGCKDDHKDLDWLTPTRKRKSTGLDEVDSPVKKARVVTPKRRVDPAANDTTPSPEKAPGVKKVSRPPIAPADKRKPKIPKASSVDETDGASASPVKKRTLKQAGKVAPRDKKQGTSSVDEIDGASAPPIKERTREVAGKGASRGKKPDTSSKLPNACYPPQLGFSIDNKDVKRRPAKEPTQPAVRRSARMRARS